MQVCRSFFIRMMFPHTRTVLYYSTDILSKALPDLGPYISLLITVVNAIMTFPPIVLIEVGLVAFRQLILIILAACRQKNTVEYVFRRRCRLPHSCRLWSKFGIGDPFKCCHIGFHNVCVWYTCPYLVTNTLQFFCYRSRSRTVHYHPGCISYSCE